MHRDQTVPFDPAAVGARAAAILAQMQGHHLWDRFTTSSMRYSPCWATYTDMPSISRFDLDTDGQPLLVETMRALALKAAVFALSCGDEKTAELVLPLPVDDMVHAVRAQHTVMSWSERDLGVLFPHDKDLEDFSRSLGQGRRFRAFATGTRRLTTTTTTDTATAAPSIRTAPPVTYPTAEPGVAMGSRAVPSQPATPGSQSANPCRVRSRAFVPPGPWRTASPPTGTRWTG